MSRTILIVALLALLWPSSASVPQLQLRIDQSAPIVEPGPPNDDGNFSTPLRAVLVEVTPDRAPLLIVGAETRTAPLASTAGSLERSTARNREAAHQLLSFTHRIRAAASGMDSNRATTLPPPIL